MVTLFDLAAASQILLGLLAIAAGHSLRSTSVTAPDRLDRIGGRYLALPIGVVSGVLIIVSGVVALVTQQPLALP